jgi:hypothetical protein
MTHAQVLFLVLQVIFIGLNYIEAKHDHALIKIQQSITVWTPTLKYWNEQWHKYSSVYYLGVVVISVLVGKLSGILWLSLVLLTNRALFFEYTLNVLVQGWKFFFYMDNGPFNGWLKLKLGRFANYLGQIKFVVCILLTLFINWLVLK